MDRAQGVLDDSDASKEDRLKAKLQMHRGREMQRGGRIAERFRDASRVGQRDQSFGNALKRFGAEAASEMAGTYGRKNQYSNARNEITEEQRSQQLNRFTRKKEALEAAKAEAGGMRYGEITGKGKKAQARREAALRAREYNKSINRQLGRASRMYGAAEASSLAQAAGIGRFGA